MTTARRDTLAVGPSRCSRVAAGASVALAAVIAVLLPALAESATYLAILAAVAGTAALVAGSVLWSRVTLLARAVAVFAAAGVVVADLLQLAVGLPGVSDAAWPGPTASSTLLVTSAGVLLLLGADAVRRKPRHSPDRPYAL